MDSRDMFDVHAEQIQKYILSRQANKSAQMAAAAVLRAAGEGGPRQDEADPQQAEGRVLHPAQERGPGH